MEQYVLLEYIQLVTTPIQLKYLIVDLSEFTNWRNQTHVLKLIVLVSRKARKITEYQVFFFIYLKDDNDQLMK